MSPRETSARRRPSLSLRQRPRTAAHPVNIPKEYALDQWKEASRKEFCHDHNASAVEEMEPFPEGVPRRRSAKSFSSLRHPMDGLVALGRRLSVTLRHKPSKSNIQIPGETDNDSYHYQIAGHSSHKRNVASQSWDKRSRAWSNSYSINRRPSLNSVTALHGFYAPTASVQAPIPGHGMEPPILPNDKCSGAAARAAAAAQNERMEIIKLEMAKFERGIPHKASDVRLDSESGIGIDLRDRSDVSDIELDLLRIGKFTSIKIK